jgi:hypothetical protein
MDIGTFVLIAVVIILFEFALHTRNKINNAAKEKFEEWKNGYLNQDDLEGSEKQEKNPQPVEPEKV